MGLFNRNPTNECSKDVGHCRDCKWWQGQASGTSDRVSLGLCMHAELVHFNLEVSGESGCNRFAPAPVLAGAETEVVPAFQPTFA